MKPVDTPPVPSSTRRRAVGGEVPEALAGSDPRSRLLRAMAVSVSEKGYGSTTVADVFREFFIDRVAEHASLDLPWRERVERTLGAYLRALAATPGLTGAYLL